MSESETTTVGLIRRPLLKRLREVKTLNYRSHYGEIVHLHCLIDEAADEIECLQVQLEAELKWRRDNDND